MSAIPLVLARIDERFAVLACVAMVVFFMIYVVHSWRKVKERREIEQTRREVSAYVAEGSITPDDAVKLLEAGRDDAPACSIADGVAWGTISPQKAERLFRAMRTTPPPGESPAPS